VAKRVMKRGAAVGAAGGGDRGLKDLGGGGLGMPDVTKTGCLGFCQ